MRGAYAHAVNDRQSVEEEEERERERKLEMERRREELQRLQRRGGFGARSLAPFTSRLIRA